MKQEFIFQKQRYGCGIACVKTLLARLTHNPHYAALPEPPCDQSGLSLTQISDYALTHGLTLQAYKGDASNLRAGMILLLNLREGKSHLAYLDGMEGGRYRIFDPDEGFLYLTSEQLEEVFIRVYLEVVEFTPQPVPKQVKKSRPLDVLAAFLSILPNALVAASILLLGFDGIHPGIPILLFAFALLSIAVGRYYQSSRLKAIDRKFMQGRRTSGDLPFFFTRFCRYKSKRFTMLGSFISLIFGSLLTLALLSLYEPFLGLSLAVCFLSYLSIYMLIRKKMKYLRSDMSFDEFRALYGGLGLEGENRYLSKLSQVSWHYAQIAMVLEAICLCFAIVSALVPYFIRGSLPSANLIVYGLASYYCMQSFSKLVWLNEEGSSYKADQGYFEYLDG